MNINELIDELEPQVRQAFLDAVQSVSGSASVARLESLIASGDIEAVLSLLNIAPNMFDPLTQQLTAAYHATGAEYAASLGVQPHARRGVDAMVRWDSTNPRATAWIQTNSAQLVTEISENIRTGIRAHLATSVTDGVAPRRAALDLVGRIDRTTGRRVGGIIGLHSRQIGYVQNAARDLQSRDFRSYLSREARDRRFDSVVRRAARDGVAIPQTTIDRMVARYSDNLLRQRGEDIARTEMLQGFHNAQDEMVNQMVDDGQISRDQVTERWDASEDSATRSSHKFMDGQVADQNGVFTTGAGYRMRYPGDRSLGAPAQEIINCRCRKIVDIDFIRG